MQYMHEIGENYGVNPVYFGLLYFGTVPLFWYGVARLIQQLRSDRPVLLPLLLITISQAPAYIYLFWAGNNLPDGVYVLAALLLGTGVWRTVKRVRRGVHHPFTQPPTTE